MIHCFPSRSSISGWKSGRRLLSYSADGCVAKPHILGGVSFVTPKALVFSLFPAEVISEKPSLSPPLWNRSRTIWTWQRRVDLQAIYVSLRCPHLGRSSLQLWLCVSLRHAFVEMVMSCHDSFMADFRITAVFICALTVAQETSDLSNLTVILTVHLAAQPNGFSNSPKVRAHTTNHCPFSFVPLVGCACWLY